MVCNWFPSYSFCQSLGIAALRGFSLSLPYPYWWYPMLLVNHREFAHCSPVWNQEDAHPSRSFLRVKKAALLSSRLLATFQILYTRLGNTRHTLLSKRLHCSQQTLICLLVYDFTCLKGQVNLEMALQALLTLLLRNLKSFSLMETLHYS